MSWKEQFRKLRKWKDEGERRAKGKRKAEAEWKQRRMKQINKQFTPMINEVCHEFAKAVKWRHYDPFEKKSPGYYDSEDGITHFTVSENEEALHAGSYIKLSILPEKNLLRVRGGRYDIYDQPTTICEKSISLNSLTQQELAEVLMDIYDKFLKS